MQQIFRLAALSALLAGVLTTSGCGNKGALYIPEPPATEQSADESR